MRYSDKIVLLDKAVTGIDSLIDEPSTFTVAALVIAGVIVVAALVLIIRRIRKK